MVRTTLALLTTIFLSVSAHGKILFEGYYKIISGGQHTGYIIQRYETNGKGNFVATSYTRTKPLDTELIDSTKALADKSLKPISYSFTSITGKETKVIDAKFEKNKITGTLTTGKQVQQIGKALPAKTFLSTFLIYEMLKHPDGLKVGLKYNYNAIAEEVPELAEGVAYIESQENFHGMQVFKIVNEFENGKWISLVTPNGEVLQTKAPLQGISSELVATAGEATGKFEVNTKNLKILFGDVPTGQTNIIAKNAGGSSTPATPPAPNQADSKKLKKLNAPDTEPPSKGHGVPGGKGIILKGSKPESGK